MDKAFMERVKKINAEEKKKRLEQASKQANLCDGAELLTRSVKYLAGIGEIDFNGWSMWRKIEQGKEHRFAIDADGVKRWERNYLTEICHNPL